MGICSMTQGTQAETVTYLEGWDGEGGLIGRGHVYTYGRFMLMFGRNQHNSVKQLSFN